MKAVSRQLSEQMTRISELNDDSVKQINELEGTSQEVRRGEGDSAESGTNCGLYI